VQRQAQAEGPPGMSGVDSGRPSSAGTQGRPQAVVVSGVGRRSPSRQLAVNNATLSGLAMGHGRQFGGDLQQLFHSPKSRQQCYPFWACNGTWQAVRRRPPAVVPLSKEWTGQVTRSRLITLICVQGTMLLFDDRRSATGFAGGAGVSSREESSAWHA
jgi:hypothetical protein